MNRSRSAAPDGSDLPSRLRERIRREGAITLHDWMEAALYDPSDGYYMRSDRVRWGKEGDYRTSPQVSPLFAATFAHYFAQLAERHKQTDPLVIMEAGAGDGKFAAGVLEWLQVREPRLYARTEYLIDELSPASRAAVGEELTRFGDRVTVLRSGAQPPTNISIIFSNELFDAFPVHRVMWFQGELVEFYVTVNAGGEFIWITGPLSTPRLREYPAWHDRSLVEGQIADINLGIERWLAQAAAQLRTGGYVVTVDYGAEAPQLYDASERRRGTLRGFREHEFVEDLLSAPGLTDLTSTVDWTFVKRIGESHGLSTMAFQRLDQFLLQAGLEEMERLSAQIESEAESIALRAGAREMILPSGMTASFQVLVQEKTTLSQDYASTAEN